MYVLITKFISNIILALSMLVFVFHVSGCGDASEPPPEPEPMEFSTMGRGQSATLPSDTTEVVIRDAEEWTSYQEQLRPHQPFSEVDFEEMMVLVAARQVNSGGYSIQFDEVHRFPDEIVARYTLTVPEDDCMTTMALATPFQVVQVPRLDLDIRFESRREIYRCAPRRGL